MLQQYKSLFFFLVLTLVIGCSSNKVDQKSEKAEVNILGKEWTGRAISYSGYRNGQDPRTKVFPSKQEVLEDLKILEKNWDIIRTYGADQHTADILDVIIKENIKLKVMLGIWIDGEPKYIEDNKTQINYGIELANIFNEIVIAINVGNESQIHWSDHKVPSEKLISYITNVKSKVSVPVTTADTWDYWTDLEKSSKIIEAVDFVAVHIYPIWGKVDIDRGMTVTKETYKKLISLIPNKNIIIFLNMKNRLTACSFVCRVKDIICIVWKQGIIWILSTGG